MSSSRAKCLMLQGTSSNAGKSLLTALLARALTLRGIKVKPFKPQNMSNNAFVTKDGLEMGRAQVLQAQASQTEPHHRMNPILLKPEDKGYAQLVVNGLVTRRVTAQDYHKIKRELMPIVLESFSQLQSQCDLILIEGAGSPAEINLRDNDIANMGFALAVKAPVLLIADISRGGVFASIMGTHALLAPKERQLLKGYLINQMRGDMSLLAPAIATMTTKTKMNCLGIIPHFDSARYLPAEDSLSIQSGNCETSKTDDKIKVLIPRLPHIANSDDFDPLIHDETIACRFVEGGDSLSHADAIILPGSKAVRADMEYLFESGWAFDILAAAQRKKVIFGLCGGYQMLGRIIRDPLGIEGNKGETRSLGLLQCDTVLQAEKILTQTTARETTHNVTLRGFEIHNGETKGEDCNRPLLQWDLSNHHGSSAMSSNGLISGCYLHGYFHNDEARQSWLKSIDPSYANHGNHAHRQLEETLNDLASQLSDHISLDDILSYADF